MSPVYIGEHNIVSPLAFTSEVNFEKILAGDLALQQHFFPFSDKTFCCAKINEQHIKESLALKFQNLKLTKLEMMVALSVSETLEKAGLDLSDKNNLLILSTTKGNIDVLEGSSSIVDPNRAYLPAMAKVIKNVFNCVHEPVIVSNACISGVLAIIIAERFLRLGQYKNIVVCGADLVTEFTLSGFRSFNALSDAPCRPFDLNRKGINLGEAAASIVLTNQKPSNIIIKSGATANDANHISGPSRTGQGLYQAIQQTLEDAKISRPDFINAHGTATEFNDEMEAVAFSRMNLSDVPVNSLKGIYGHTLGAAGVLESIITIQSLVKNTLLRSVGFETKGTSHLTAVIEKNENKNLQVALKTASGFGGCNAAAIFQKI